MDDKTFLERLETIVRHDDATNYGKDPMLHNISLSFRTIFQVTVGITEVLLCQEEMA